MERSKEIHQDRHYVHDMCFGKKFFNWRWEGAEKYHPDRQYVHGIIFEIKICRFKIGKSKELPPGPAYVHDMFFKYIRNFKGSEKSKNEINAERTTNTKKNNNCMFYICWQVKLATDSLHTMGPNASLLTKI